MKKIIVPLFLLSGVLSCTKEISISQEDNGPVLSLSDVAEMLAGVPFAAENMREVHDAVQSSSANGYDDEYTFESLFHSPGTGVGDDPMQTKAGEYPVLMRDLIEEYLMQQGQTKAAGMTLTAEEYMYLLYSSPTQIYWPNAADWDGSTLPVITFAPDLDTDMNIGYEIEEKDGQRQLKTVRVDEKMASSRPVWVLNNNEDAGYETLELLRRKDPSYGEGGGGLTTKAVSDESRSLILKNVTLHKNMDSWFFGSSEILVKVGSVEDFTASTEAELKLYKPSVTDVLIVVKRSEVDSVKNLGTMLVSSWTPQLQNIVFMMVEDDGGTQTSWKCTADVKVKSKTYGMEIELPINSRDDLIWRGQLSSNAIEKHSGNNINFGEVDICFDFI